MKSGFSKKGQAILAVLLVLAVSAAGVLIYKKSSSSSDFALVGTDYMVNVTKRQFDQFGQGKFSGMDLKKYTELFGLEKIYFDDIDGVSEEGSGDVTASPNPSEAEEDKE